MTTKFILHGGYAGRINTQNDAFFAEVCKDVPSEVKVLLVYFAKNESEYNRIQKEDIAQFEKNKGHKQLTFETASPDSFIDQVRKSDIIYLHGGQTLKLLEVLKKYPDFSGEAKGKTIAGESAGSYALSACFYSETEGGVFNGLGLVPVKTVCHYEDKNEEKLDECSNNLETLLLRDYEYCVF
jgi:peptidase E